MSLVYRKTINIILFMNSFTINLINANFWIFVFENECIYEMIFK